MLRRCPSFSLPLILFVALAAGATTLARMSLEELAGAAEVIARVRCLDSESRWEAGEIWTFTRFEVVETLKGTAPRLLTVRLLGGRAGHSVSLVEGVPRFRSGEEAVLFLERSRADSFSVTSWVQGTFRIRRNAQTGEETVTQDSSRFAVLDPATQRFAAAGVRKLPLAEFRRRLAEALERPALRRQP